MESDVDGMEMVVGFSSLCELIERRVRLPTTLCPWKGLFRRFQKYVFVFFHRKSKILARMAKKL